MFLNKLYRPPVSWLAGLAFGVDVALVVFCGGFGLGFGWFAHALLLFGVSVLLDRRFFDSLLFFGLRVSLFSLALGVHLPPTVKWTSTV